MPQEAATGRVVQRDFSEMTAAHIGDAVVAREPLVYECVVCGQQVDDASVLVQHARKEQFCFALEPSTQILTEIRKQVFVRLHRRRISQAQPLPSEIGDERFGPWIREHATGLGVKDGRVPQLPAFRDIQQFVVGNTAPQKEGEP